MVLIHNKKSASRPGVTYGHAGEVVTLVSVHDQILIVEGPAGNRFTAVREDLPMNPAELSLLQDMTDLAALKALPGAHQNKIKTPPPGKLF